MTENTKPGPEQPTVRFRQLCKVSEDPLFSEDTLLALSEDGVVYRGEAIIEAREFIWRKLLTVTSTQLEVRPCSYPGCTSMLEFLPGSKADTRERCTLHQYRA
jgi:hypothetical protein